jgi:sensor histidine kinase regulating citrate/malate metabolism
MRNSLQAIEEASRPEGRIEVATRDADDIIIIEITDDGCGILN